MLQNQDILNLFIDKCCVFMGDFMNASGTGEIIDKIKDEALEEFAAHRVKYNGHNINYHRNDITNKFNDAKKWLTGYTEQSWGHTTTYLPRTDYFLQYMSNQWRLGTAIPVTINKEMDADDLPDEVYVNGIKLTKGVFDGKLFKGRQITIEGKTYNDNALTVTGWEIKKNGILEEPVNGATCTFTMDDSYQSLSIKAIMSDKPQITGDVNHDGKVDVADVTTLVDHILGNTPQGFNPNNCDVNNDTKIDVSDVTSLVDIILNNN